MFGYRKVLLTIKGWLLIFICWLILFYETGSYMALCASRKRTNGMKRSRTPV